MGVASGGVGLPDLDQAVAHRAPVAARDAPRDDDPLPQRLAGMLAGKVVIQLPDKTASKCRSRRIREGFRKDDQGLLRCPESRRHVIRIEIRGLDVAILAPGAYFSRPLRHAVSPFPHSTPAPILLPPGRYVQC